MRPAAFAAPGRFFRGNLHTHSTRSDGVLEPGEVCRRYRDEGYDFLSLTDHFVGEYGYPVTDTTAHRAPGFTTLPGAEIHSGAMENGEIWHILAVGLPADFVPPHAPGFVPVEGQESGPALAARAAAAGAWVAIAHPQWSGLTLEDARSLGAAHAVEVYNHGCAMGCDRGDGFHTLDLLLSEGRRLDLCATDDAHFTEPDHFGGWVHVKAEENDAHALLASLRAGAFYASQGPQFHDVVIEETHVALSCSPVVSAVLMGRGSAAVAVHGLSMTRARLPRARLAASPWLRVALIDAAGRRAWTNPVWPEAAS